MTVPAAQDQPPAGHITLRYWASARAVTGTAEEQIAVSGPVTLAHLIAGAITRNAGEPGGSARVRAVLACCSVLLGDRQVANQDAGDVLVEPGETVEFLPPFAGG